MIRDDLERALKRDDLTLTSADVSVLSTVESCVDLYLDPSTVLVEVTDRDEPCLMQALEVFTTMNEWESPLYVYVPLAFGPVQEGV